MQDDFNRIIYATRLSVILIIFSIFFTGPVSAGTFQDTLIKVMKGSVVRINEVRTFINKDTIIAVPSTPGKYISNDTRKTLVFYDSLKAKSSKLKFTKTLFDLVIIMPDTTEKKKIITRSDDIFEDYRGMRIGKITIRQLDVFGSDIDNPGLNTVKNSEKILNKTHFNTTEKIILKNLLFREGDTISPLTLSENERILRQLPYIDDSRIIVVPLSPEEAEVIVVTRDIYSLGADFTYRGPSKGSFWLFDKNIFGMGHEFKLQIPYSAGNPDSPGIGIAYKVNNIGKSFINLNLNYYNALGKRTYGFIAQRELYSADTKYAGGIAIRQMYTSEDLDTLPVPQPLEYNYQDYWLQRSFLIDRSTVTRFIAGLRFINDNIFNRPDIDPDSYYALQKKYLLLGSVAFTRQRYFKTNLLYSYGRTEDIPYGSLVRFTGGIERNEFKNRYYFSSETSFGYSVPSIGYIRFQGLFGTFVNHGEHEQAVVTLKTLFYSNLLSVGRQRIRNFINVDYTRGINRYSDEYLNIPGEAEFRGFKNDSIMGGQRVRVSLESVIFNPVNFYGFRFAFFGFANLAFLAGTNQIISTGNTLTSFGVGMRIRNDNLVFNTFQLRFAFYPLSPPYSDISHVVFSGEQLLRPKNFEPGTPDLVPYR